MSDQSTPAPTKRQRLAEILVRLGPDATTAMIREEAWKVGFGAVNNWMMVSVRNEVWPDRVKRRGGLRSDGSPRRLPLPKTPTAPCPECGHIYTSRHSKRLRKTGLYYVQRKCVSCKFVFSRHETDCPKQEPNVWQLKAASATEKQCTYCKRVLPVGAFATENTRGALRSKCLECGREYARIHVHKQKLAEHGLTIEDYEALVRKQDNRCAICCSPDKGSKRNQLWSLDHSHATGRVRGLLCSKCNTGIGLFNDNPKRLEAAAHYLRQHEGEG